MDVDTTKQRDVWLVKVPKYLAKSWEGVPGNSELGKLFIPTQPGDKKPIKFIANQSLVKSNGDTLPSEHVMTLQPTSHQRMVVLSRSKDDKISFDGDVKQKGEVKPNADSAYMKLKSLSIKEAAKPKRLTQIINEEVASYKPRGAAQLALEAEQRKKKEEARKTIREDKEVVQGRLFKAFEKQQYFNIKDLVRLTAQSTPYLKEILKEICNYCSSGAHKNMWELKPEYRHYKSASSSK